MNTFGNLGSAVSPVLLAYLVGRYGWSPPFLVCSVLCTVGALLSLSIDAENKDFLASGRQERGEENQKSLAVS